MNVNIRKQAAADKLQARTNTETRTWTHSYGFAHKSMHSSSTFLYRQQPTSFKHARDDSQMRYSRAAEFYTHICPRCQVHTNTVDCTILTPLPVFRYVYMNQRRKEQGLEPHPRFQHLHGFNTQKLHQVRWALQLHRTHGHFHRLSACTCALCMALRGARAQLAWVQHVEINSAAADTKSGSAHTYNTRMHTHTPIYITQENLFAGTSVPVSRKDPTWVQIKLPTGALVNVLVDENDQIVARDAAGAGSGALLG